MFEEISKEIGELREKVREKARLKGIYDSLSEKLACEKKRLQTLDSSLRKEGRDVDRFDNPVGLTILFYSILGEKETKLEKERQEYLAARLRYEECKNSIEAMQNEMEEAKSKLEALGNVEEKYARLMEEKEKLLMQSQSYLGKTLLDTVDEIADARSRLREINEAGTAGKAAMKALGNVENLLESARNWGTWDMLGGGFIATAAKHSRIDDARDEARNVQNCLRRFNAELSDINCDSALNIDIGNFETFADYFLDGLIVDWVVQSRINEAMSRVHEVRGRVRNIMNNLEQGANNAEERLKALEDKKIILIEEA